MMTEMINRDFYKIMLKLWGGKTQDSCWENCIHSPSDHITTYHTQPGTKIVYYFHTDLGCKRSVESWMPSSILVANFFLPSTHKHDKLLSFETTYLCYLLPHLLSLSLPSGRLAASLTSQPGQFSSSLR